MIADQVQGTAHCVAQAFSIRWNASRFFCGRERDEHVVSLDLDREDLDLVMLAAEALARLERKGLLVHGAGDLRGPLLIAEDAPRQDHLAACAGRCSGRRTTGRHGRTGRRRSGTART